MSFGSRDYFGDVTYYNSEGYKGKNIGNHSGLYTKRHCLEVETIVFSHICFDLLGLVGNKGKKSIYDMFPYSLLSPRVCAIQPKS